jgi:hypothetical protein
MGLERNRSSSQTRQETGNAHNGIGVETAMIKEGVVPPPVPGPPVPGPHVVVAPSITPPPGPPPLIPAVKPVSVSMTVDAHDVIDATVAQLESTGSTLMTAAIQEAFVLLDPLLQKYMDQMLKALPGLIAGAVKHLLVKESDVGEE